MTSVALISLGQSNALRNSSSYQLKHPDRLWSYNGGTHLDSYVNEPPFHPDYLQSNGFGGNGRDEMSQKRNIGILTADLLLDSHLELEKVYIRNIAVNGSYSWQWAGTDMTGDINESVARTSALDCKHVCVLWMQGEGDADRGTKEEVYSENIRKVVEKFRGLSIAFFVPQETYHDGVPKERSEPVRAAQRNVVDNLTIFAGPDLDSLVGDYRDGTHFSPSGVEKAAQMWCDSISKYLAAHG